MTLLEVLVAIAVMAVIATLTWTAIGGSIQARDLLAGNDGVQASARVVLGRVTRELQLAWLTPNLQTVQTYRTVFVGQDTGDVDTLWFASLSHQRHYRDARECDQTEITLWGERDPDGDAWVLLHREAPRVDQEPDEGGTILPLAYGVMSLNLRYLDGNTGEWEEEWSSVGVEQANRLPRAVQIVMVLLGPDPEDPDRSLEHTYATTVLLEFAAAMTKSLFSRDGGQ